MDRPQAAHNYTPGHLGVQAVSRQLDLHRNHSHAMLSMHHPLTYPLTLRPNSVKNTYASNYFFLQKYKTKDKLKHNVMYLTF